MTPRPVWVDSLTLFDYCYYTITDLLFVVFGLLIVFVVSRAGWRQHLRWANSSAISCVLTGCGRFVRDMHFFFGLGSRWNAYLSGTILYDLATVFGLYSTYMLWRTLRDLARHPASPDPLAEHSSLPGVWPPAPTLNR
jgi:hypothetical protein